MAPEREQIVVTEPDPNWAAEFRALARRLRCALGDVAVALEHVGSTAVPGLAAKPIVDLDVVVANRGDVSVAVERLAVLGYEHVGTLGIAGREAFVWPRGEQRHHVFVVVEGSAIHRRHVGLRDCLIAYPDLAALYARHKCRLALEHRDDRGAYTRHKSPVIEAVLAYAAFDAGFPSRGPHADRLRNGG